MTKHRKNVICTAGIFIIMTTTLTACNIPGVTVPYDEYKANKSTENVQKQENNSERSNDYINRVIKRKTMFDSIDKEKYELDYIPDDMTINDMGEWLEYTYTDIPTDEDAVFKFKINKAVVYEHLSESEINGSKVFDMWELFDGEAGFGEYDKSDDARILLCDIDLYYSKEYVDWSNTDNITKFSLVYMRDDGAYIETGYPIYFSAYDSSKVDHNAMDFNIHEGSMNLQAAWTVDKEMFGVDEFDLSKLYICINAGGDADSQRWVRLGLTDTGE